MVETMNIGIVTTWFERGAAYVSRIYKQLLEEGGHSVYIFARGGENHKSKGAPEWNEACVTRSDKFCNTRIEKKKFYKWIKSNKLECLFFNEQHDYKVLVWMRRDFPNLKLGAYVDYYTEDTLKYYRIYDFLVCNTKRHIQAMNFHKQKYYIEWGTDIDLYNLVERTDDELVFFHSAGMSVRKGTDILVESFIEHKLYKSARLIIHTQIPIEKLCGYNKSELTEFCITIIEKTVSAPGLYHLGDVYVYPTRLDGLGLTMYEALACGMPLITTDFPPMNEVGDKEIVRHIKVKDFYCRGDAYYFPMCICDKDSLAEQMRWFIDRKEKLQKMKEKARQFAVDHYDIKAKTKVVCRVFEDAKKIETDDQLCKEILICTFRHTSVMEWLESYWSYHRFRSILRSFPKNLTHREK